MVFISCSTDPEESKYITYKIKVDKISHPDTLNINDTLSIKFWGIVGFDGCHDFKNFEANIQNNEINITVWGTKPNYDTACPAVIVYLEGKEYKTLLQQTGNYKIIINQPDNSTLESSLIVN